MKTQFTIYLILIFILGLIPTNFLNAANLATQLKGKILLQVEQNGEAWYVNPVNELRYYLGRPNDAFNIMRELGLGISNKDFDSFNGYAPSRLSGRILLKVADSGKAYYVNTNDLKMYYLGRPADAFNIMRELGLGITDKNLGLISMADMVGWKTYTHSYYGGWTIKYPKDWQFKEFNTTVGFSPASARLQEENDSHIGWTIYQNSEQLSLEDFFNGKNKPNYFTDAMGGIENITVDGLSAKKFKKVGGIVDFTITAIPNGSIIVELIDRGERHQTDKIYDRMLQSINF